MTERMRTGVLVVATILILALANLQIAGKEAVIRDGRTVLLRLAPVDPRSLMQGDYMALRYSITGEIEDAARAAGVSDGFAILRRADNGEAGFVALFDDRQLADDEVRVRFRRRGESVRVASDAFFFEEGSMDVYRNARYGELRVSAEGDAVLTGLVDDEGRRLGKPLHDFD